MDVRLLRSGEEEEWNRYVGEVPGSVLGQRAEWSAVFREGLRQEPRYLVAEEGGNVRGVLPLVLVPGLFGGRSLVSLPWLDAAGPLAADPGTADLLLERAVSLGREERCSYVEVRSLAELPHPRPVRSTKVVLHLPLAPPEEMWERFSATVRNQVRKAEREGLSGSVAGEDGLGDFYRVFARNMRDIGVPVWGIDFFRSILRSFGESARLVLVRRGRVAVGGALLLLHRETAVVPSASSLRRFFPLCPNHVLYWTALREAHALGAKVFDFGRSTPGAGTYHFKKQWGAEEKPCFWHYALLSARDVPERHTEAPRFRMAAAIWRRLPLPIASRLGPAIVRRIP